MIRKQEYKVLNCSFPDTLNNISSPDDIVYACEAELDIMGTWETAIWNVACFTEKDIKELCFWFRYDGRNKESIRNARVKRMTAGEFFEYQREQRGMNPFEDIQKFKFAFEWIEKFKKEKI